jgi:hypothetical protein
MPVKILFTFALVGGVWVEYANGRRNWEHTSSPVYRALSKVSVGAAIADAGQWVRL